ncbi:MAG: glycosyltransferase [Bacillus sp. (in: firmicutes)]
MSEPKVSIIVPVFNVEEFLIHCIDSLVNQTLKDIEIILVNDGSTDYSLSICQEYEKQDSRVRVVNKENGGLSSARNAGLDIASGKYIAFCDSDDYVDLTMYEKLYHETLKREVDLIACGIFLNDYEKQKISLVTLPYPSNWVNNKDDFVNHIFKKYFIDPTHILTVWNLLFKRELIEKNNLRFAGEPIEDYAFILQYSIYTNSFIFLNKPLYYYRVVSNSLSRKHNPHLFEILLQIQGIKDNCLQKMRLLDNKIEKLNAKWFIRYAAKIIFLEFAFKNDSSIKEISQRSKMLIMNTRTQDFCQVLFKKHDTLSMPMKSIVKTFLYNRYRLAVAGGFLVGKLYRLKKRLS